ncbi:hypothetical protein EVAR_94874_1 [Eumeta japonica]|uniref:Uncharacterized protein n=1 Tax=Eumeta variegata TaxID=151549 RepID=A0A4C1V9L9_EUMVA|nr:hypothetical protein EVAR_94874_1 [Eumeta japonica]
MESATSYPSGTGGEVKKQVTHAFIKNIVTKALQDMGYECPDTDLVRFIRTATPASSRVSSTATSPASSQASSHSSTRSSSPSKENKRRASSFYEEETSSDSTVISTDNDSGSVKSSTGKVNTSQSESFTLVKGKNKKAIRKALKRSKTSDISPSNEMDVDASRAAFTTNNVVVSSPPTHSLSAISTQATNKTPSVAGTKPTVPPRSKIPPPIFLCKGATFLKISADCTKDKLL